MQSRPPLPLSSALLFGAVLFAFSPVIVDLGRHLVSDPSSRYSALFLPLLVLAVARETAPPPNRVGYAWLALGLLLAGVAVAGGEVRLGRLALPLGIVGFCRAQGLGSLRTLLLIFWMVPIPHALTELGSPEIETLYLRFAASLLRPFGLGVVVEEGRAAAGGAVLELTAADGGLPLFALLSGLGWYAALPAWPGLSSSLARAMAWGFLALPIQAVGVLVAVVCLSVGAAGLGRLALTHALWVATAVIALTRATRPARAQATRAKGVR